MNKIESIKKEDLNETSNVSSAELFGIKYDFEVPQFVKRADHCPTVDKNYVSITPIQIDLTDHKQINQMNEWIK